MAVTLENGKSYQTVAERLREFRNTHPAKDGWGIVTTVEFPTPETVRVRAEIKDPSNRIIATGHSEEKRSGSLINMTSAVENAETSAIGRALFAAGFGNGEFCSAEELVMSLKAQADIKAKNGDPWTKPYAPAEVPAKTPAEPKAEATLPTAPPATTPATNGNSLNGAASKPDASNAPATETPGNGSLPVPPPDVEWQVKGEMLSATGKGTFDSKEALKSMGFRWDKNAKLWTMKLSDLAVPSAEPTSEDAIPF